MSNEAVVTLSAACTDPGAPGSPVATVLGGNVTVSWTPAAGATSHMFEAGWLPRGSSLVNAVMNAAALSAQAPSGVYFVRARGRNA